mmetsp:Transcript_24916/g.60415  ORF Transcript_24916/g.60415 Transcript_24916/m.60415 type:complete len:213 (-) Transcript_24916:290-928(-)
MTFWMSSGTFLPVSRSFIRCVSASLSSVSSPSSFLICLSCSLNKNSRWDLFILSSICVLILTCKRAISSSFRRSSITICSRFSTFASSRTSCNSSPLADVIPAAKSARRDVSLMSMRCNISWIWDICSRNKGLTATSSFSVDMASLAYAWADSLVAPGPLGVAAQCWTFTWIGASRFRTSSMVMRRWPLMTTLTPRPPWAGIACIIWTNVPT